MVVAAKIYQWLIWLVLLALPVQFLLAGLGVMGGEEIDPHQGLGSLIQLIVIVLFLVSLLGRMGKPTIMMTLTLLVLSILQSIWAAEDLDPQWLRSLHVLDALLMSALVYHLATRVGMPMRSGAS
ncbi:MAG TPA: DUF6220 domain-containing protein [Dehalococcoidia bacterium]|nr:DUF6220 domain-containing protein [Dehalococcoidia bacterium]